MKKYFILATAAVVALAACSKNNIETTSQEDRVINFSTVAGKATKAPINGTTYGTGAPNFGVFCYALTGEKNWADDGSVDGQLYMDNVEIHYDDETDKIWKPSSVYYWPLSGSLTFIGYSPYATTGTVAYDKTTKALSVTNFTVNSTASSQQDLMYADTNADLTANQSLYSAGGGSKLGVNIVFHHALSQVKFNVKKAAGLDAYDITVNSITFHAKNKGTLTVTEDSPVWSGQAYLTEGAAFDFNTTGTNVTAPNNADAFASFGVPNMPVPQTLAASDQTFTIRYSLKKGLVDLGSKTVTKDLYVDAEGLTAWAPNTVYNYNIVIDLDKIYFTPSIYEDWGNGASQVINVPN